MKFGIIADDNTGATDAAGMLTEKGVRTILFLDLPAGKDWAEVASSYEAAIIGTGARSVAPKEAYERTAAAAKLLREMNVEKIQVKYCSTFDSTPEGNIGPSLDAAMDVLEVPGTIVCPALPVNGRTTYFGYHYVNGVPLAESPMKDHPLNPMADSSLVRWLQHQTKRRVSLASLPTVRQGADVLKNFLSAEIDDGYSYLVTDAVEQSDLTAIAQATVDWPLISGGSGITAEIPGTFIPDRAPLSFSDRLKECGRNTLVVAGSCSPATRGQNAFALSHGFSNVQVNGLDILEGKVNPDKIAAGAEKELACGKNLVLYSSADPKEVERVQKHGAAAGLSVPETGEKIASVLAEVTAKLIESGKVGRLIISGGETSGVVCRRLGIWALEIGLPIDPGVPYCFPIDGPNIVVALKSGNFGSEDFYLRVP